MPVYTGSEEVRHAKREYLQQITPAEMIKQLVTHRGRRWVTQTVRAVRGHIDTKVPSATVGDDATLAALPGGFVAIPTPGHTSGHTAYLMPSEAVVFSGDALVTGHPLLPRTGPQLLPTVFNHDEALTRDSAHKLAGQSARTLVPGHGLPTQLDPTTPMRLLQQDEGRHEV
jgi:glyoxylase-like metal-dependent hydrolase (beta-lactamase superfamily II)